MFGFGLKGRVGYLEDLTDEHDAVLFGDQDKGAVGLSKRVEILETRPNGAKFAGRLYELEERIVQLEARCRLYETFFSELLNLLEADAGRSGSVARDLRALLAPQAIGAGAEPSPADGQGVGD